MATTPLASFYDLILLEVPGCPYPIVDRSLIEVSRAFCQSSSAWRQSFDDVTLVAGIGSYSLDSPEAQSEVVRVTRIAIDGILLWDDTDLDQFGVGVCEPKYNRNHPPFTVNPDIDEITLMSDEVPTTSGILQMVGALSPIRAATELPTFLLDQYGEAIRLGVLSRLLMMGNQPWSDRQLAAEYRREADKINNFAAYNSQVGNTQKHLRVKSW